MILNEELSNEYITVVDDFFMEEVKTVEKRYCEEIMGYLPFKRSEVGLEWHRFNLNGIELNQDNVSSRYIYNRLLFPFPQEGDEYAENYFKIVVDLDHFVREAFNKNPIKAYFLRMDVFPSTNGEYYDNLMHESIQTVPNKHLMIFMSSLGFEGDGNGEYIFFDGKRTKKDLNVIAKVPQKSNRAILVHDPRTVFTRKQSNVETRQLIYVFQSEEA